MTSKLVISWHYKAQATAPATRAIPAPTLYFEAPPVYCGGETVTDGVPVALPALTAAFDAEAVVEATGILDDEEERKPRQIPPEQLL